MELLVDLAVVAVVVTEVRVAVDFLAAAAALTTVRAVVAAVRLMGELIKQIFREQLLETEEC